MSLTTKTIQKRRVSVSLKVCDTLGGTNHLGCITSFIFVVILNCYLSHIFSFSEGPQKSTSASGREMQCIVQSWCVVPCRALQCCWVEYIAIQICNVQYSESTVVDSTVVQQCSSALQCCWVEYIAIQSCKAQYSESTVVESTVSAAPPIDQGKNIGSQIIAKVQCSAV